MDGAIDANKLLIQIKHPIPFHTYTSYSKLPSHMNTMSQRQTSGLRNVSSLFKFDSFSFCNFFTHKLKLGFDIYFRTAL